MRHSFRLVALSSLVAVIVLAAIIAVVGASSIIYMNATTASGNHSTHSSTSSSSTLHTFATDYTITNDPTPFFPDGYYSLNLNFVQPTNGQLYFPELKNGQVFSVGSVKFNLTNPPNVVTMSNGEVAQYDYICPTFFYALSPYHQSFIMDYCTPWGQANHLQAATTVETEKGVFTSTYYYGVPASWSMWEIRNNVTPEVGVHVEGIGGNITLIQIAVGQSRSASCASDPNVLSLASQVEQDQRFVKLANGSIYTLSYSWNGTNSYVSNQSTTIHLTDETVLDFIDYRNTTVTCGFQSGESFGFIEARVPIGTMPNASHFYDIAHMTFDFNPNAVPNSTSTSVTDSSTTTSTCFANTNAMTASSSCGPVPNPLPMNNEENHRNNS